MLDFRMGNPSAQFFCYRYESPVQGDVGSPLGIPGLHIRLGRKAALELLALLSEAHNRIVIRAPAGLGPIPIGTVLCTGLDGQIAQRFSKTHTLQGFRQVSFFALSDADQVEALIEALEGTDQELMDGLIHRMFWSRDGEHVTVALNARALHRFCSAIVDTLFVGCDDYAIPAKKCSSSAEFDSKINKGSEVWVWSAGAE
jgi:hypothetical protein